MEIAMATATSMKAVRIHEFGGPEVLREEIVPMPAPGPGVWAALLGIALVSTAFAYILYFRLLQRAGPVAQCRQRGDVSRC